VSPRSAGVSSGDPVHGRPSFTQRQETARFHRERDRRRLRSMVRGLLGAGLLVVLVLGMVAIRVQQVRLSYRLDGLRAVKAELEENRARLRVELATLTSLARIENKARAELGMVRPANDQVRLAREFVTSGDRERAMAPLTASAVSPSGEGRVR
jgi:cell division protein FtsL